MKRAFIFVYGIVSYLLFFATFVYMILFLGDFSSFIPKTVNGGSDTNLTKALLINTGLIFLFGLQHSAMARKSFKEWWTNHIPRPAERSTYVLFSSLALILLMAFWQPLPGVIWNVETTWATLILDWGFWLGWLVIFLSTWMIDHFNLFGIKQVWNYMRDKDPNPPKFMEPGFYKYVRHPLMLGFFIAFWSISDMTLGHLIFSTGMSLYILVGVYFEEKAMVRRFGKKYKNYRERVPKFVPGVKGKS